MMVRITKMEELSLTQFNSMKILLHTAMGFLLKMNHQYSFAMMKKVA
jgi:hypothetical protein